MRSEVYRSGLFILAAVAALSISVAPASANGFGGGVGLGAGGVYGFDLGAIYRGLDSRVPYFAAHPPVYYSYPVPRTYGYTPFAYPPHVATPDLGLSMGPITITNPYVETTAPQSVIEREKTVATPKSGGPLVIHNPYADGPQMLPVSRAL